MKKDPKFREPFGSSLTMAILSQAGEKAGRCRDYNGSAQNGRWDSPDYELQM